MEIGAGIAALAFWGFIATCVVAGVWDNIRKREAKHETLRRMIEAGQPMDEETLTLLGLIARDSSDRPDRGFKIAALWLLPISVGLAVLSHFLGAVDADAESAVLGSAFLTGCLSIGAWIGGMITAPWYESSKESKGR
jgi:hypothetical protein